MPGRLDAAMDGTQDVTLSRRVRWMSWRSMCWDSVRRAFEPRVLSMKSARHHLSGLETRDVRPVLKFVATVDTC